MLRTIENLVGSSLLDGKTILHNQDAVGEVCHNTHVVSDQQNSRVQLVFEVAHQVDNFGLNSNVECRGRLVRDQERGVTSQGLRDHRTLALTTRKLVWVFVDRLFRVWNFNHFQKFHGTFAGGNGGHVEVRAQSLDDLESDGVHRVQRGHRLLEDVGDLFASEGANGLVWRVEHLDALDLDGTRGASVRGEKTHQAHRRRGLARAGFAHDSEDLTRCDLVVHVDCGWIPDAVYPELDVVVLDLENWLYVLSHDLYFPSTDEVFDDSGRMVR